MNDAKGLKVEKSQCLACIISCLTNSKLLWQATMNVVASSQI